jgi:hypothetical protein
MLDFNKLDELNNLANQIPVKTLLISPNNTENNIYIDFHYAHLDYVNYVYQFDKLLTKLNDTLFLYEQISEYGLTPLSYNFLIKTYPKMQASLSYENLTNYPVFNQSHVIACEGIKDALMNIVEGVDTFFHRGAVKVTNLFSNSLRVLTGYYDHLGKLEKQLANTRINDKYYAKIQLKNILTYDDLSNMINDITSLVDKHRDKLLENKDLIMSFDKFENSDEIESKLEDKTQEFKTAINEFKELNKKPVRTDFVKIVGYTLDNVTELCDKVRVFIRSCNETFSKELKYLKSDKSIDKHIKKYIEKVEHGFKWDKKTEKFKDEQKFKDLQKFSSKLQVYFRIQSGFYDLMVTSTTKLTKMYIYIADQFLRWGRQNKQQFENRNIRRANQQHGHDENLWT